MATFIDTLKLIVDADLTKAAKEISQFGPKAKGELEKVQLHAGQTGGQAGTAFSGQFQKTALAGFAVLASATASIGGARFLQGAIQDAVELARAEASLAAQVQAVGAESGVTDGSLARLAGTVQNTQAIFSGTVKQAEALLLTFREVKNEAGAGNDVFNRTIGVSAALSNVFGRDLTTVTLQLGRALENPLTGMQALQRSGVTLSQQLRTQIREFAQQGDLLSAQKALLAELEKRYTEAGAAIAKADPFQQFSVSFQEFKTQVGGDFLPIATEILQFASGALHGFEALPGPIRSVTEGLAALAIAAAPLFALHTAFTSLNALTQATVATEVVGGAGSAAVAGGAAAGASTGATQAASRAELEQAAAVERANIALQGKVTTYERVSGAAAGYRAQIAADVAAEEEYVAVTNTATASTIGFGGAVAAVLVGVGTFAATSGLLETFFGGTHEGFDKIHTDFVRIANDVDDVANLNGLQKLGTLFTGRLKQDQKDIEDLNKGFTEILDTQGADAAGLAYGKFALKLRAVGLTAEDLGPQMQPFLEAFAKTRANEAAAAADTDDLTNSFHQLVGAALDFSGIGEKLSVEDAYDSLLTAQDKVKEDYKDLIGVSDKAKDADRAVADAVRGVRDADQALEDSHRSLTDSYGRLKDAQDKVADSTRSLKDAQRDLDEYNSPRGAEERRLQHEIIKRRVTTTPGEYDQKQLDLLKERDDNERKQRSLTEAVSNAQRGLRDALKGVADAQHGIEEAQRGVRDATERVADANDKVADSVRKRQKLESDAAKALDADQRKAKEAYLKVVDAIETLIEKGHTNNDEITVWATLLKGIGDGFGGVYKTTIDKFYDDILSKQQFLNALIANEKNLRAVAPPQGPIGPAPVPRPGGVDDGKTTPVARPRNANGNIYAFAAGGIKEQHDPRVYTPQDGTRKFNEPETGGEAYIPLSTTKRARSTDILKTVADGFGLKLVSKSGRGEDGGAKFDMGGWADMSGATAYADGGINKAIKWVSAMVNNELAEFHHDEDVIKFTQAALPRELARILHDRDFLTVLQEIQSFPVVEPGTIDIFNRPVVHNADGTISTVRSISVALEKGLAALLPTVINGAVVSNDDAIRHYLQTHEHLGIFGSEGVAEAYAQLLHHEQDLEYSKLPNFDRGGVMPGLPGVPGLAVVHGGERVLTPAQQNANGGVSVHQENHFHGKDTPSTADLDYANRDLGWRLARMGRG